MTNFSNLSFASPRGLPSGSRPRYLPAPQGGFSIVELLVAIAIGLILIAGLAALFANSSRAGNELEKSIRQIENGRYAAELLTEDISIAGYYGELSASGMSPAQPLTLCATATTELGWSNAALTVPTAVAGITAVQAATLGCLPNLKAGTGALALRHLDTQMVTPGTATDGTLYLQTSRCATDPNATKFVLSTASSDFTLRDLDCTAVNKVQKYVTRIYYVASCSECNGSGADNIPTLKVAELKGSAFVPSPLVEGIEEVTYDYGFDTDVDGNADVFRTGLSGVAGAADNTWSNVVGIRVNILSRTTESTPGFTESKKYVLGLSGSRGPFSDEFKRRAYSTTVRINNVAGPREIP